MPTPGTFAVFSRRSAATLIDSMIPLTMLSTKISLSVPKTTRRDSRRIFPISSAIFLNAVTNTSSSCTARPIPFIRVAPTSAPKAAANIKVFLMLSRKPLRLSIFKTSLANENALMFIRSNLVTMMSIVVLNSRSAPLINPPTKPTTNVFVVDHHLIVFWITGSIAAAIFLNSLATEIKLALKTSVPKNSMTFCICSLTNFRKSTAPPRRGATKRILMLSYLALIRSSCPAVDSSTSLL